MNPKFNDFSIWHDMSLVKDLDASLATIILTGMFFEF